MEVFLRIAFPLIIIVLITGFIISKRKANTDIKHSANDSVELVPIEGGGISIPIERVSALSINEERHLAEITDKKIIARITQTIPAIANKASKAVMETAIMNADIYRAVLPSGETLVKSKDVEGYFRGIYRNAKGIKGHANLEKLDPKNISKASKLSNIGASAVNVGSLVVGQYYMSEINSKLEIMNTNISKISDFQEREFKSRIMSLIALVGEISQFSTEIIENDELRTQKLAVLENRKSDAMELLGQVNETIINFSQSNQKLNYKEYPKKVEEVNLLVEFQNVLIVALEEISKLTYLLGKGEISNELCYSSYNKYWEHSTQARKALGVWHDNQVMALKIDLDKSRRTKSGIEGYVYHIPGYIDEKWRYNVLDEGLVGKINSQSNLVFNDRNEPKAVYNNDVQIIMKDGNYYYLPDSSDSIEEIKEY